MKLSFSSVHVACLPGEDLEGRNVPSLIVFLRACHSSVSVLTTAPFHLYAMFSHVKAMEHVTITSMLV